MSYASLYFNFTHNLKEQKNKKMTEINEKIKINKKVNYTEESILISHGFVKYYHQLIQLIQQMPPKIIQSLVCLFSLHYIFTQEPNVGLSVAKDINFDFINEDFFIIFEIEHKHKLGLNNKEALNVLYIGNTLNTLNGITYIRNKINHTEAKDKDRDKHIILEPNLELNLETFYKLQMQLQHKSTNIIYIDVSSANQSFDKLFEIIYKNICLNPHTICIIKITNTFERENVEFIYHLASIYPKISIMTPALLNIFSLDKIIICKRYINTPIYSINYISPIQIPYIFLIKLNEINVILGQYQINILMKILYLSSYSNECIVYKKQINKCVDWCIHHNIPYNSTFL